MAETSRKDRSQPRGPAPNDNPEGAPACDPDPTKQANPGEQECPDGYPDEERRDPQMPEKDDPAPKPRPSKEGN